MSNRRVVITGIGAISPLGNNFKETWQAAKQGRNGISEISFFDTSELRSKVAGEVKGFDPLQHFEARDVKKLDRFIQFALVAAREAMASSGIKIEAEDSYRCAVLMGSGIGGMSEILAQHKRGMEKGFDRVSPHFIPMAISNMASGCISMEIGFKGLSECVVTACASSASAIGSAFRGIRHGYFDVALCGGTEATIIPLCLGGFSALKALTDSSDPNRASIPFDKERKGFVMGEGAAALMLEEYEHAVRRGANIICELSGYGATNDAYHMTAPAEDGEGAVKCIRMALEDAGIKPEMVGYINAHGTSTPMNDRIETLAVKKVFGEYAKKIPISSTKSMTGHMLGASGAMEAALTAFAVKEGVLLENIGYKVPDENCDLEIITKSGMTAEINYAISNSLGFGGHNVTLVMGKWPK